MSEVGIVEVPAAGRSIATLAQRQQTRRTVLGRVFLFAVGATSFLQIANFTLTGLSVVCLVVLPAYLLIEHRAVELVPLLLAGLGWLAYLASCLANGLGILAPNALAPAAFVLYLAGLTVLVGFSTSAIATVLAGVAAGTVLFHLVFGIELSRTGSFLDLWKYGIAPAVTILVMFTLAQLRAHWLAYPVALVGLALLSLVLNYRSHALICLVSAAILLSARLLAPRIGRGWQYVAVFGAAAVFAVVMPVIGRVGLLGSALQAKLEQQDQSNLPLLFAGRTEPPLSVMAISERPLLGWGSAEHVTPQLFTAAEHLAIRLGYSPTLPFDLYWRMPPDYGEFHSIILGSWAEAGVVAVLWPLWLLGACLLLVWNNQRFGIWAALVVAVAVQGTWDLVYSPWTYNLLPIYACLALFVMSSRFDTAPKPPALPDARRKFGGK